LKTIILLTTGFPDKFMEKVDINRRHLDVITAKACRALDKKKGIFVKGAKRFLPQFNIPQELEYSPPRTRVKKPRLAAHYLWTSASFERRAKSRELMAGFTELWEEKRWFFNPREVIKKSLEEITEAVKKDLRYGLSETPAYFLDNAKRLITDYGGNPRNLIVGRTVEEARTEISKFRGVGPGIANLFILYMFDRKIALPADPENLMLKIDVHKARVLINTEVIKSEVNVRRSDIVPLAEIAYRESCRRQNLDPSTLDAALWIIGSEVCNARNYEACVDKCPFAEELCKGYVPENRVTGKYLINNPDSRIRIEQTVFPFMFT
jgi:endonuclease III